MKEKYDVVEAANSNLIAQVDSLKSELELVKESRDKFELEKEDNNIKVLILKFRKLTIEDFTLDSSLAQSRHRPEITWSEPPVINQLISPHSPNCSHVTRFTLTPSRLTNHITTNIL